MITIMVVAAVLLYVVRRRYRRSATTSRRRGRAAALAVVAAIIGMHTVIGTPAMAQPDDTSCAPFPERPGAGMVGAIDPSETRGLRGGPYTSEVNDPKSRYHDPEYPSYQKFPNSPYLDHGYAGMVWHTYDPDCKDPLSITSPNTTIDTWIGNELFNVGKNLVGATSSLHYTLYAAKDNGGLLGGLTNQISQVANSIFNNIYGQLFSIFMLVLAVLLFRQIWRGDLATVSRRALFALAGMWLAASSLVIVGNYASIDRLIIETTTGIQNGFEDPNDSRVQRHVLPTELNNRVIYENWLRGEFGAPNDPKAKQYGRELLAAQAWKWEDLPTLQDGDTAAEAAKRQQFEAIYKDLGPAQGYFTGRDGSRAGSGFLAMFQGFVYSFFQFLAKLAVLLAQALLRIFTLAAPVIGLVALVHHDVLRRVGRAIGAVVLNLLILAVLAGIHFRFLEMIFGPGANLSMLTQMLLAGVVTLIFLLVGRPLKRMWQMVELSVNATGVSMPSGGLFSRLRRRKGQERGPQDEFWDNLRDEELAGDTVATTTGRRRPRPEAAGPVTATAERLDNRRPTIPGGTFALPAGGDMDQVLMPSRPGGRAGPAAALPQRGPSRIVDTVPVTEHGWGEDAMVVPSRVTPRRGEARFEEAPLGRPSPRPADVEMVAGRPVHVVYRPSRGLEVREPAPRRMPLRDGPRETDSVVR